MKKMLGWTMVAVMSIGGLAACSSDKDSPSTTKATTATADTTAAGSGESSGNAAVDEFCAQADELAVKLKDVIANPGAAINDVKARDGIVNVALETRRLQLAIDTVINSPNARLEGFGQVNGPRLALMASQVSDAFNTKTRVNPDAVWNGSFLPAKAALDVLPK